MPSACWSFRFDVPAKAVAAGLFIHHLLSLPRYRHRCTSLYKVHLRLDWISSSQRSSRPYFYFAVYSFFRRSCGRRALAPMDSSPFDFA